MRKSCFQNCLQQIKTIFSVKKLFFLLELSQFMNPTNQFFFVFRDQLQKICPYILSSFNLLFSIKFISNRLKLQEKNSCRIFLNFWFLQSKFERKFLVQYLSFQKIRISFFKKFLSEFW